MIKASIYKFWNDTSGAITIPWIAAGGLVVIIGASATTLMEGSSETLQEDNRSFFENIDNTGGEGTYN
ncbi:hypothetical protein OS190_12050 [Sulfitobacter sp. F26204]|uniref:hypothetical protein n=1 Tax=Sulfitobacter sp. F26204 TaxID=2996014 RepID=UPI00225DCF28|nr:hypothetical protein [Sulfitobacter sp. F26204]MCX7560301.1 hypothetical protein [Sulfitobacter sp. F26204]